MSQLGDQPRLLLNGTSFFCTKVRSNETRETAIKRLLDKKVSFESSNVTFIAEALNETGAKVFYFLCIPNHAPPEITDWETLVSARSKLKDNANDKSILKLAQEMWRKSYKR